MYAKSKNVEFHMEQFSLQIVPNFHRKTSIYETRKLIKVQDKKKLGIHFDLPAKSSTTALIIDPKP